jgi:predicted permease
MKNDLRFALRMIASHAWFSAAIVVTLALGIGVNTTVFTLVNAVLFKPVPLRGGARLVVVANQNLNETNSRSAVSYPDFLEYKAQAKSLEGLEAVSRSGAILSENGIAPARYTMGRVSWGLFEMIRTPPVLGRGLTSADDKPAAESVALIGYTVWKNRYGSARDVIGRVIRLNGQPTTIVGVMPEGFRFPGGEDLWIPLVPTEQLQKRSNRSLQLFALLRPEFTMEQAGADLAVIAKQLATSFPDTNKNIGVAMQTFHQAFNGGNIRTIFLLMLGAVGFVLLIACANVANMMLSRALARKREISVRAAMGASRWQLIRQLLIESVLLSSLGGFIGLVLSLIGVHYFDLATLEVRPYWIQFNMDWVAFGYFAAISICSGLLFGLVPALRASRVDLNVELKEGTRTAGTVRGGWLAGSLVILQFALTLVLLSGAGLMVRSFFKAQTLNAFVPAGQIFTARISLPERKGEQYAERNDRVRFYDELLRRLAVLPGVTHATIGSGLPGGGAGERRIEVEGKPTDEAAQALRARFLAQSPGFLPAIGMQIEAGRGFDPRDGDPGREAAIATRDFAARHWPNQTAIGKRFRFIEDGKPGPWIAVVGVTGDLVQNPMSSENHPLVFVPHRQEGWGGMALLIRTANGSPAALANPVRSAIQNLDPDLPLFEVMTLNEALEKQRWFLVVFGALFFSFAAIGLLIAAVGIYGVVAQATAQRTREIGIRMALGATARGILAIMLSLGLKQLSAGLVIGLAGALATTRLMKDLLMQVSPQDPMVLAAVAALLVTVGLFACWLPARRAAALHPVQALRDE